MLGQQTLTKRKATAHSSMKVRQMIGNDICHLREATRTGGVKTLEFDNTLRYCNMLLASTPIKNGRINHRYPTDIMSLSPKDSQNIISSNSNIDQRYPSIRKSIMALPWLILEHLSYPAIAFPDRVSLHNQCNRVHLLSSSSERSCLPRSSKVMNIPH